MDRAAVELLRDRDFLRIEVTVLWSGGEEVKPKQPKIVAIIYKLCFKTLLACFYCLLKAPIYSRLRSLKTKMRVDKEYKNRHHLGVNANNFKKNIMQTY